MFKIILQRDCFKTCNKWAKWSGLSVDINICLQGVVCPCPGAIYIYKSIKIYTRTRCQVNVYRTTGPLVFHIKFPAWIFLFIKFLFMNRFSKILLNILWHVTADLALSRMVWCFVLLHALENYKPVVNFFFFFFFFFWIPEQMEHLSFGII